MDKDLQSTELRIYFEFASRGDEVPEKDIEYVKSRLDEIKLSYEHYDEYNISTEFFVDTDDNMEQIDELESKLQSHFSEFEINRFTEDDEAHGSEPGTYQIWISIESHKNEEKSHSNKNIDRSIDWDDRSIDWDFVSKSGDESDSDKKSGDESDSDKGAKESKFSTKDVEWRERDESARSNEVNDSDETKFHPPCEHCGSTVFKQELTTTNYVECDAKGNFVDQETEHERDEVIYCIECGRKLSERTTY